MFGLSTIKIVIIAGFVLLIVGGFAYCAIVMHNRETQITLLGSKLDQANQNTEKAIDTANANAAAAKEAQDDAAAAEKALQEKNEYDVKIATDITNLKNKVINEKPAACIPPAIVAMVDGLRQLQTRANAGNTNSGAENTNSAVVARPAPTTPRAADQSIAAFIGDLFQHDEVCINNVQQIKALQTESNK